MNVIRSDFFFFFYLFELEDDEHVRATAVGVHVSGGGGSSPGPLLHQLLHLHLKLHTLTSFLQTQHGKTLTQDTEISPNIPCSYFIQKP